MAISNSLITWRGDWALVTGASSGIGREFALQLAAAGLNLVLVARRREVLDALAQELREKYQIEILVVGVDLTRPNAPTTVFAQVSQAGVRVRLLVNNAGAGRWGRFETVSVENYERVLQLNNQALVGLCREFFPSLSFFSRSAVINISSQAALQPVPFMAVYAASKAFLHSFSLALYEEWKKHGIYVQTCVPGPTATEFDEKAGAYASDLGERHAASQVVAKSLRSLASDEPLVTSAKGIYKQKIFNALAPSKFVLKEVAKMFRPLNER